MHKNKVIIEKKNMNNQDNLMIFEISRMAAINGPGIRTMIHFKGCNLDCRWCSTPESKSFAKQLSFVPAKCIKCLECVEKCPAGAISFSNLKGIEINRSYCTNCMECAKVCCSRALSVIGENYSVYELMDLIKRDANLYRRSGGGVTLSGGEALLHVNAAMMELLTELKQEGISVGFDTAGYVEKCVLDKIIPFTDFFLWDVKLLDSYQHKKYTGKDNDVILDNLRYIDSKGVDIYLRCPIIPGVNNNEEFFSKLASLAGELHMVREIHLLPFHKLGEARYSKIGLESPYFNMGALQDDYILEQQQKLAEQGYKVKIIR